MNKKLLRKKLALMLVNLKKKRPYYCEVEYLESRGNQWIALDISALDITKLTVFGYANQKNVAFVGGGTSVSSSDRFLLCTSPTQTGVTCRLDGTLAQSTVPYEQFNNMVVDITNQKLIVNGIETSVTYSGSFSNTKLYMFVANYGGSPAMKSSGMKINRAQFENGNNVVLDLIPVLDWNYTPCMYDKVSGQLFYNQGSDSFTYGREIHYVEYLESTGTQYIDTGFTPTTKTRWEYDYQFNNTSSSYIGNGMFITTPSTQRFAIGLIDTSFNMSYGADNVVPVTSDTNRHNFIIDAKNMYWQIDNTTGTYATAVTATLSRSIYFFARNGGSLYNPHSGKLYGSKIYDNDVLVREYKPAIDENGVGFMFDRATHTIYDNAGTGVFKYPAREVEYLESTGTQYILTGFTPTVNTDFEIELSSTDTLTRWAMGCPTWVGVHYKAGTQIGITNSSTATYQQYTTYNHDNSKITMKLLGNTVYANNVPLGTISRRAGTLDFALFGYRDANQGVTLLFIGSIYKCIIWDNDILTRDFIPVFLDGQAGMLDKANNVFYGNAGTGTFVAGKVKEDLYEN